MRIIVYFTQHKCVGKPSFGKGYCELTKFKDRLVWRHLPSTPKYLIQMCQRQITLSENRISYFDNSAKVDGEYGQLFIDYEEGDI